MPPGVPAPLRGVVGHDFRWGDRSVSRKLVETIYDTTQFRRACVFRRDDGTFGFYEEHFSDDEYERCWVPRWPNTESFCDSLETVLREVRGRVSWLTSSDADL